MFSSLKRDAASVLQLKAEKKIAPMDTDALVTRDGEKDGQVGNFNLLAFQAIKCQLVTLSLTHSLTTLGYPE